MKISKFKMKYLLLLFFLVSLFSCNNADQNAWQDELKATAEYVKIVQLKSKMHAEDPLIKPGNKIDKYTDKLSDQEAEAFFATWKNELQKIQKETHLSSTSGFTNNPEAMELATQHFVQAISKSKLPEILKTTMIESAEQNTEILIEIVGLAQKLQAQFPQLEKDPAVFQQLLKSNNI